MQSALDARATRSLDYERWRQAVSTLPQGEFDRIGDCRQYSSFRAVAEGYGPALYRSRETGLCRWGDVCRCANAWGCALCMRYDVGRRRRLAQACVDEATSRGMGFLLITFTFPHQRGDALDDQAKRFLAAQSRMCGGRAYQAVMARLGVTLPQLKDLETTWGPVNGWHTHRHCLAITDAPIASPLTIESVAVALQAEILPLWRAQCAHAGLLDLTDAKAVEYFDQRAVDVRVGYNDVQEYVAKHGHEPRWSLSRELTAGRVKRGGQAARFGHRFTPCQLLDAMQTDDVPALAAQLRCGPGFAVPLLRARWLEYMRAFSGGRRHPLHGLGRLCAALGIADDYGQEDAGPDEAELYRATIPESVALRRSGSWLRSCELTERDGLAALRAHIDRCVAEHLRPTAVYQDSTGKWRYRGGRDDGSDRLAWLPAAHDPADDIPEAYPGEQAELEAAYLWMRPVAGVPARDAWLESGQAWAF